MSDADSDVITLHTPITALPGMTRAKAQRFGRLDVHYVIDLLRHFPRRYEFEHEEATVAELPIGGIGSTRGELLSVQWIPGGGGRYGRNVKGGNFRGNFRGRFQAVLEDDTGKLHLVWFNAAYLRDKLHAGATLRVQGEVKTYLNNKQMVNPKWSFPPPRK